MNYNSIALDRARATALGLGASLIDGKWEHPDKLEEIEVYAPADGSRIGSIPNADTDTVNRAVLAARQAFDSGPWPRMSPADRAKCLWRVGDLIEQHAGELAMLETLDCGKPLVYARNADVRFSADLFRYMAGAVTKIEGATIPISVPGQWHTYTERVPVGVVAAISAWNFPLLLGVMKVAAALAAGNTVILKPSEWTPYSSLMLGRIMQEAGIPDGVFQLVTGGPTAGDALVRHPGTNMIAFTGSTAVGRQIAQTAGQDLKRVSLELGGKSGNIIFADADLDLAIPGAAKAIFYNAGQNCMAGSRLFVHDAVQEKVLESLADIASKLRMGGGHLPTTELGPMISMQHREHVLSYIESARKQGANIITGGSSLDSPGYFIEPTVISDARPDMKVVREEIFGPVLVTSSFSDEGQAINMANDTQYGLAAGLWTNDLSRAHRVSRRLRAGNVFVNSWGIADPAVPFGGMKASGLGRENGLESLDSYLETKATYIPLI